MFLELEGPASGWTLSGRGGGFSDCNGRLLG